MVQQQKIGDQTLSDSGTIAQALNNHFVGSVEDIARTFKTSGWSIGSTIAEEKGQLFELEISRDKVVEIINKLKTTHSKDLFNLDIAFVKRHVSAQAEPLTHLLNTSIVSGTFPEAWKQARVIPIFKSGAVDQVNNYRPIRILPALAKILEKAVATQLMNHLESINISTH